MNDNILRIEKSENCSGQIYSIDKIPKLKEKNYIIQDYPLDGDAPKQFICLYEYKHPERNRKGNKKMWVGYIAKTAEKWYPHESIIEYSINKIGELLGLKMNETKLVIANTQIRFLSKYFLNKEKETLVHGAEICGEHYGNMNEAIIIANNVKKAREVFTFEFVKDAIRLVFPDNFETLMTEFVKMLVFDSIVGNNDRHFYNWGIIRSISKEKNVIFAPLYDSARGLLWNLSEENIDKYLLNYKTDQGSLINKYILNSKPRISLEENSDVNHFELINFLKAYNQEYAGIIDKLLSPENEESIFSFLRDKIFLFYSRNRQEAIELVLKLRLEKLREI